MTEPFNVRYEYLANRDFDLKRLQCRKGQRLPQSWQDRGAVRWLKREFGEDCVRQVVTDLEEAAGRPDLPTPIQDSPPPGRDDKHKHPPVAVAAPGGRR